MDALELGSGTQVGNLITAGQALLPHHPTTVYHGRSTPTTCRREEDEGLAAILFPAAPKVLPARQNPLACVPGRMRLGDPSDRTHRRLHGTCSSLQARGHYAGKVRPGKIHRRQLPLPWEEKHLCLLEGTSDHRR